MIWKKRIFNNFYALVNLNEFEYKHSDMVSGKSVYLYRQSRQIFRYVPTSYYKSVQDEVVMSLNDLPAFI